MDSGWVSTRPRDKKSKPIRFLVPEELRQEEKGASQISQAGVGATWVQQVLVLYTSAFRREAEYSDFCIM
ncbi:hypothetical protein AgCh_027786 [Apium graveolens]